MARMPVTAEEEEAVLGVLLEGKTMKHAARELLMSYNVLAKHACNNASFRTRVANARAEGAHARVDALDDIAADKEMNPHRARLLSENIKWTAARLNPKAYGDRMDVNVNQTIDIGANLAEARGRARLIATHVQPAIAPPVLDAVFTALPDLRATDTESVTSPVSVEPSIFD